MPKGDAQSIPKGWVETTLGGVADIKYGKDHKKLNNGNIPCLGSGGIMRLVNEVLYDKPSVLIPRKGTLSNLFYIDKPFWTVDTLFYTEIDENFIIPKYLFFKLKTIKLEDLNVGSAVPSLTTVVLNQLPITIPKSIKEQKAIAQILTAFDDKIELLQAQNKTLETTAQTIFKEWFGKYQIGDELPEGWRVGKLGEVGKIICGKTPSKANKKFYGEDIPFIKIPDMHGQMFVVNTIDNLSNLGAISQKKKMIPTNSICVSCIATVGLVSLTVKNSQTNQQINSIVPLEIRYKEFLYFAISKMYKYLQDLGSGGTATLNINTSTFSNIEIVIPNKKTLDGFHEIENPIFDKILSNSTQIQTLKQTRDTLLPKLMSGQLRVDEFKERAV
jgi:type I restriction enzyme S subunit